MSIEQILTCSQRLTRSFATFPSSIMSPSNFVFCVMKWWILLHNNSLSLRDFPSTLQRWCVACVPPVSWPPGAIWPAGTSCEARARRTRTGWCEGPGGNTKLPGLCRVPPRPPSSASLRSSRRILYKAGPAVTVRDWLEKKKRLWEIITP